MDNSKKKRVKDYFSKVSDAQLKKDVKKAGYDFYKKVKNQPEEIDFNMRSGRHCHSLSLASNKEKK